MTTTFLSCWLTGRKCPQHGKYLDSTFDHIKLWYESINKHNLNGVMIHDNFCDAFVERYTTKNVTFVKNKSLSKQTLSPNDYRFTLFEQYILKHDISNVFITDADVSVRQNFDDRLERGKIYVGSECKYPVLDKCPWVHKSSGYSYAYPNFKYWEKPMLNVGISGGSAYNMLKLLGYMNHEFRRINPIEEQIVSAGFLHAIDMPVFTHCVYTLFDQKQIVYGEPVCSKFSYYERDRNDVWFVHK